MSNPVKKKTTNKGNFRNTEHDPSLNKVMLPGWTNDIPFKKKGNASRHYGNIISGELENIGRGVSPTLSGEISPAEAICLCQRAYWNISIFRQTIDIQTEFSNSKLHFTGGSSASRSFFKKWYKKIKGTKVSENFFREWFRSSNIFLYKFDGELSARDRRKLSRNSGLAEKDIKIPIRYTILNPADIKCSDAASFVNAKYYKVLNNYEVEILRNPKTEEDKAFVESLTQEQRDALKNGLNPTFQLDSEKLITVFYGKQDYESIAIPMYYPVLTDLDLKLEFKKMEKSVARTADYFILLITAGETGEYRNNSTTTDLLTYLHEMFSIESVGRVLVSDATTKGEFLLPDLKKIMGPEKYESVNEDIANGLMNIFWGQNKFAESMVKIKVFLERLRTAREAYINEFLIPEMEKIAKVLGFKDIPNPQFEDVDIQNEAEYLKLYLRMTEDGLLTPEELFEAYNTHILPSINESLENQKKFKELKENGLYQPLLGGNSSNNSGRPKGSKAPQTTKDIQPAGATVQYSLSKLAENTAKANELLLKVEEIYKKKNKVKRLSDLHKRNIWVIAESVMASKDVSEWVNSVEGIINNPIVDIDSEIETIAAQHGVNYAMASLLKFSKK